MLVLGRKKDQVIMLGDDIEIMIVDVQGDRVRVGIKAPREIEVHRREIWLQKKGLPPERQPGPLNKHFQKLRKSSSAKGGAKSEAQDQNHTK